MGKGPVDVLGRAIRAYEDGDEAALGAPDAVRAASELWRSVSDAAPDDTEVLGVLTHFHWYSYEAGSAVSLPDAVRAAELLRGRDPEALPPDLATVLDTVDFVVAEGSAALEPPEDDEWRDWYAHLFFQLTRVWDSEEDDPGSLDRAIAAADIARSLLREDDSLRAFVTALLGRFLSLRGHRARDVAQLTDASALLQQTLEHAGSDHRLRAVIHVFLTGALANAVDVEDTPATGIAFAKAATAALAELPLESHEFAATADLAVVLAGERLQLNPAAARDLDEQVAYARLSAAARPGDHPERYGALYLLAVSLHQRAAARQALPDNTEAIATVRELAGLDTQESVPAQRALPHLLLSQFLDQRLILTGDPASATEAVQAARHALSLMPADDPERGSYLTSVGAALYARHEVTQARTDLDEAIEALSPAAARPGPGDEARTLSVLGICHYLRYDMTGDVADLEAGVRHARAAVAVMTPDDPGRPDWLGNLATALLLWHKHFDAPEVLDEAVELMRTAAELTPVGHADRERMLGILGDALMERYTAGNAADDLEEAIAASGESVASSLPGTQGRDKSTTLLSNALRLRHGRYGDPADLDEAVRLAEVPGPADAAVPVTARALNNLGIVLLDRAGLTGSGADLDRAIDAFHRARAVAAPGSTHAVDALLNLGNALEQRYRSTGVPGDLADAVAFLRQAQVTDLTPPKRRMVLINLAKALALRCAVDGSVGDLDEAADALRDALATLPPGHARRPHYLSAYGTVLTDRWERTRTRADLDEAVGLLRAAVEASASSDPRRGGYCLNLGVALEDRYRLTGREQDRAEAVEVSRAAAGAAVSAADVRVRAARRASALAWEHGDVEGALSAARQAVGLLPLLAWRGIPRADQERRLSLPAGLASEAAAFAVAAGRAELAVELLEQGRSVMWAQLLDTREDLTALTAVRPDLAERLGEVRTALDTQADYDVTGLEPPADRTVLARRWDQLVAEVRELPGFQGFLRPRSFAELAEAAVAGPVVLVNFSVLRSDALVVRDGAVRVVPLPGLDAERLVEYLDDVFATFEEPPSSLASVVRAHLTVTGLLEWLWTAVTGPVLDAVGPVPRMWWCPTGLLAFLPLHAALRPSSGECALDLVVSSYTPTLRDLITARRGSAPGDPRLLVVSMPRTPGAPDLAVEPETDTLRELFGARATLLTGPDATRQRVLDRLGVHPWVHFACHGRQDLAEPSRNALMLHDEPLEVLDVARLRSADAELAFLSACRTASGGAALPDEAIHLAASLRTAGFRHVLGTLWPIYDAVAPQVSQGVYTALAAGAETSQTGVLLHRAVQRLRDAATGHSPVVWAPYIHIGP
ncbi:CHAT domain-containing protein [Streptomyces sp. NPDC048254]|uniref:CHAT domain-containing protein n=1 Tax=Streptomyces sp. NPDC048254 TaxID=3365525 RepID=UPI00371C758F